ncbi:hypothetical protein [Synechococcus sp. EJ6-Ellesmere]|uniref:hypothetical protein n=1 Tax=Synechococcus sp. EJ6-Ellesmere TaxID=2823734 RepID=UPI0020CFAD1D|nr:hypothetical protein [Synechococcus sp. EJ6-Ellesmere]MCP9825465.1 hypothetical protein [Synechococcus sp. EJ6-Ellesmere]
MGNPIDTLNVATGAEVLPLELLHPLDGSNPASTPVRLSGPEQRLTVTPDPGVGDAALLPPSQLLISKDGESRSIWPVHLAGWQALGWQLQPDAAAPQPEPEQPEPEEPEPEQQEPELAPAPASEPEAERALEPESAGITEPEPPTETATGGATGGATGDDAGSGEARLAVEPPDFPAMTKAQIVEFCSTVYGVELDGSQTKTELVEQATALEAQASGSNEGINDAADLAALELGDALL